MLKWIARFIMAAALFTAGVAELAWSVHLVAASIDRESRASEADEHSETDALKGADKGIRTQGIHPHRSLQTRIWLWPAGQDGQFMRIEHVIRLAPTDPLVPLVRFGDAALAQNWPVALVGKVRFNHLDVTYHPPVLRVESMASDPVIRVEGEVRKAKPYDEDPDQPMQLLMTPASDENTAQTVSIRANGWTLVGVTGNEPSSQDAHSLDYASTPSGELATAWVPDNAVGIDRANISEALGRPAVVSEDGDSDGDDAHWTYLFWEIAQYVLILVPPWLVLWIHLRRSSSRLRNPLLTVSIHGLLMAPLVAVFLTDLALRGQFPSLLRYFLAGILPVTAYVVARMTKGERLLTRRGFVLSSAAALAAVTFGGLWLTWIWEHPPPILQIALLLITGAVLVALSSTVAGRRSLSVPAGAAAVTLGSVAAGMPGVFTSMQVTSTAPILACVGVVWVGVLSLPIRDLIHRPNHRWRLTLTAIGIFSLLPLSAVNTLNHPGYVLEGNRSWPDPYIGLTAATALLLVLLMAALLALRDLGADPAATTDPSARGSAYSLVVAVITIGSIYHLTTWWDVWRVLIALAGLGWLLPSSSHRRAHRLAHVTPGVHRRMVGLEVRRRLLQASARDLRQSARTELATGQLDLSAFDDRSRTLAADQSNWQPRGPSWIGGREAALSSACGRSPWANARFAVIVGLILSLPYLLYEEVAYYDLVDAETLFDRETPIIAAVGVATYLVRWAAYGLLFGYFMPLLRGRSPVVKSIALWAVLAPVEILPLFSGEWEAPSLFIAILIRTGQLLVFALGLGLGADLGSAGYANGGLSLELAAQPP